MPTSPQKRGGWIGWTLAALLLVFGYCAAYLGLMTPEEHLTVSPRNLGRVTVDREPTYQHPALGRAFAPDHWLDQRIRPQFWEPQRLSWEPTL